MLQNQWVGSPGAALHNLLIMQGYIMRFSDTEYSILYGDNFAIQFAET